MHERTSEERVAVVGGVRTPFAKRRGPLAQLSAQQLGTRCVSELLQRCEVAPDDVDLTVFGQVIPTGEHNIAREVALEAGLPVQAEAYSVAEACITGYRAVTCAAQALGSGRARVAVAGGADSASHVPVTIPVALTQALERARAADSWRHSAAALASLSASDLRPSVPGLAERSTGLSMGESAEKMAKMEDIARKVQDEFAHRSHRRASLAWERGHFDEVMTMFIEASERGEASMVVRDDVVRPNSNLEAYADLPPVFDEGYGTITAGNSSPLSDGASAMLLTTQSVAKDRGLEVWGYLEAQSYVAVDPTDRLLIGPALAIPAVLERADLTLADVGLIDMHEAFAGQVLAVLAELDRGGLDIDMDRFNVNGGSIALGHPFGATGGRQIIQTLSEMRRRNIEWGLCTACAAGGLGAAFVLRAA